MGCAPCTCSAKNSSLPSSSPASTFRPRGQTEAAHALIIDVRKHHPRLATTVEQEQEKRGERKQARARGHTLASFRTSAPFNSSSFLRTAFLELDWLGNSSRYLHERKRGNTRGAVTGRSVRTRSSCFDWPFDQSRAGEGPRERPPKLIQNRTRGSTDRVDNLRVGKTTRWDR